MKIVCQREELLAAFQMAASVAPGRSPKPILQNVLLDVTPEKSIVMATDMEVGIRVEVGGIEVSSAGRVVLPVSRFGMILRESTDEELRIETDGTGIVVRGQRSEFDLTAENPDEFPAVAPFEEEKYHELSARLLKELVRRTLFATDTESSRYALGGVLLEFEPEKIIAVGTDGRRLAKMEGPARDVGGHPSGDTMTIVPSRSMQLIDRALSDADADVQLAARPNDVLLKTPRATIYSRLVEGRYPRWRDVFPKRTDAVRMDMTVGPFFAALRQASVVTSDESRGVDFHFGAGTLTLSGSTAEVGRSRVEMPISYDGKEIPIVLDHRFVADFLKVLEPEKAITLEVEDHEGAALFMTDDGYGYVVMPLARERDR
jgi:DNA polymerase-3 subunit beta